MNAITTYNESLRIIETTLTGDIYYEDILSFIDGIIDHAEKNECYLWLIDYGDSKFNLSSFETYELPRRAWDKISRLNEMKYKIKRAIVNKNNDENLKFLETTSHNYGQRLNIFRTVDEAREWLLQPIK